MAGAAGVGGLDEVAGVLPEVGIGEGAFVPGEGERGGGFEGAGFEVDLEAVGEVGAGVEEAEFGAFEIDGGAGGVSGAEGAVRSLRRRRVSRS